MVVYPFYRRRVCSVKCAPRAGPRGLSTASRPRSEEHTSELQSQSNLVCRLLLEKKKNEELTYSHRQLGNRSMINVFGTVELIRMGYCRRRVPSIFRMDQALTLHACSLSYELHRR